VWCCSGVVHVFVGSLVTSILRGKPCFECLLLQIPLLLLRPSFQSHQLSTLQVAVAAVISSSAVEAVGIVVEGEATIVVEGAVEAAVAVAAVAGAAGIPVVTTEAEAEAAATAVAAAAAVACSTRQSIATRTSAVR
jgi:hypothetical protein